MTYPPPVPVPTVGWPSVRQPPDASTLPLLTDENVQGNVLAGFNKDHQMLFFLTWPDAASARAWLTELRPRLSRHRDVAAFNARFSQAKRAGGHDPDMTALWSNISLTAAALELLAPTDVASLQQHQPLDPSVQLWLTGSSDGAVSQRVGDLDVSDPTKWLFGGPAQILHAIVCVAADRTVDLETEVTLHRELAARHNVTVVFEQSGNTLPGEAAGHEHFGFKDGISQPGVFGLDPVSVEPGHAGEVQGRHGTDLISAGTFVLGYPRDTAPPVQVPLWMFDGSFLTTRRLTQDVPKFWAGIESAQAELAANPETATAVSDPATGIPNADALAARLVGRWRSGTPTDAAPVFDDRSAHDPAEDNAFDFESDQLGDRTPICAHIRKVYPRKGAAQGTPPLTEDDTKMRRILRRGIPFGLPFEPAAGRGEGVDGRRGLVFQCYQASLEDQFVFLQQSWVNGPNFSSPDTGRDPVIGLDSTVNVRAGGTPQAMQMKNCVFTEGSVFSFTPSLPTLDLLIANQPLPFG